MKPKNDQHEQARNARQIAEATILQGPDTPGKRFLQERLAQRRCTPSHEIVQHGPSQEPESARCGPGELPPADHERLTDKEFFAREGLYQG